MIWPPFGENAEANCSRATVYVGGSTSIKTGVAPVPAIATAVPMKVCATEMTSSPLPVPNEFRIVPKVVLLAVWMRCQHQADCPG